MKHHREKILIVDDEISILRVLETRLSTMGYTTVTASDGEEALSVYRKECPILVILDILIPKLDGFGVCQEIRKNSDVPIIILTALGDLADKLTGFELGADDYIVKPFAPKELEVRVKAILKRVNKNLSKIAISAAEMISIGRIKIDTNKRQVYKHNKKIRLTGMEFNLLELLISNSGKPFSRSSILKELWGYTPERNVDTRVVDVHISRLRSKLEHDPSNPDLILTARGIGYLFQNLHRSKLTD
uniref:probable transcriptional regulator ompR n=1 Tax=Cryptomonas gyropyrenoidosa TaxID=233257 RepID=UPI00279A1290|nr:probable transcriptional regulator ompR [Cryptomonas gyropyrenoidosa]WFQ83058.1 probable transcriptional regulator ompR [Cryptomonas gyropyrenoidosa]